MKRFLIILLTLTMLLSIASCVSNEVKDTSNRTDTDTDVVTDTHTNTDTETEADTETETDTEADTEADTEVEKPTNTILVADLPSYTIVFAKDTTGDETEAAIATLIEFIKDRYNVTLVSEDDTARMADSGALEILVGNTNRAESQTSYNDITDTYDFTVTISNEQLVLAGGSDTATAAAVEYLLDLAKELPAEQNYFFNESMTHVSKGKYPIAKLMIGENEISDYTLVYSQSNKLARVLAEQAQKVITEKTGYVLKIMIDSAAKTSTSVVRRLIIGETSFGLPDNYAAADGYFVGQKEGDVYLCAETLPLQAKSLEWLYASIDNARIGTTVTLDPTLGAVSVEDTSIKIMSFNLKVKNEATRADNVIATIKKNDPDLLGVQEASATWVSLLESGLSEEYARFGLGRNANTTGETTSIFYKKDKFTLIDAGTKWMSDTPDVSGSKYDDSTYIRIFTYVLLERKSDGERFMHINVHPEDGAAAVKKEVRGKQLTVLADWINQNVTIPFIVSGDMNSRPEFAEFVKFQQDINTENSSAVAYSSKTADTYSSGSSSMVLDYILLSNGDFDIYTYEVDTTKFGGDIGNPSDHCPIIAVIDLKGN